MEFMEIVSDFMPFASILDICQWILYYVDLSIF